MKGEDRFSFLWVAIPKLSSVFKLLLIKFTLVVGIESTHPDPLVD